MWTLEPFYLFYYIWTSGSGAIALSLMLYIFISGIRYFSYPNLAMKKFGDPIQGDNMQDFVLWWQLRRHYIENDVRITVKVFNIILTAALLTSFIGLWLMIRLHGIGWSEYSVDGIKTALMLFLVLGLILYLAQNATSFYTEQLKHRWMLIREKLRIKTRKYDDEMERKEKDELINVIDFMINDIETTVVAIKMAGVELTPNIMLVIKGYIVSSFVALFASAF